MAGYKVLLSYQILAVNSGLPNAMATIDTAAFFAVFENSLRIQNGMITNNFDAVLFALQSI
jgi:GTP cyclohydrolase III